MSALLQWPPVPTGNLQHGTRMAQNASLLSLSDWQQSTAELALTSSPGAAMLPTDASSVDRRGVCCHLPAVGRLALGGRRVAIRGTSIHRGEPAGRRNTQFAPSGGRRSGARRGSALSIRRRLRSDPDSRGTMLPFLMSEPAGDQTARGETGSERGAVHARARRMPATTVSAAPVRHRAGL